MWIDEGLPPHLGRQLTVNLNENCQDEQEVVDLWHGHLGPELKDLPRFSLWGFMKFRVYDNGNCKQRRELMRSVIEAAASKQMLWTTHSVERQLAACTA